MRNAFAQELVELAQANDKIVLLSGDIGNRLFDSFKEHFPERFYNCGVAEANMTGLAAGMALCGLRPITYTITPFATTRCLEQIRNDICYHNIPVTIVGVGAGLSYAGLGASHHSCEDVAFLRSLPNMTVICPGDATEVRCALRSVMQMKGPAYIRLGKKGEPRVHSSSPSFEIGKALSIREGKDICLLSTGNLLPTAVEVGKRLLQEGMDPSVVSFHTVKPLDIHFLKRAFSSHSLVVSLEEHSLIGGLGSAIAEWLVDTGLNKAHFLRLGTRDTFLQQSGDQIFARDFYGLSYEKIFCKVVETFQSVPPFKSRIV